MSATIATPETLNGLVEFDSPFQVNPGGTITRGLDGVYGPSVYGFSDDDGQALGEPEIEGDGWEYVNGYSGQQGYSGPVMHVSEFLGGGMARDVLDTPGIYTLAVVEDADDPDEPWGWVLLRKVNA